MYLLSSSFLLSFPRCLAQPSVSLGESSDSRVLSLVPPTQSCLFLHGGGVFFYCVFLINDTIHFCFLTWVVQFLNTFFSFDQNKFNLARDTIFFLENTVVILDPCIDILETLGLSLITFISFGCFILSLLSDKMADKIDLVFQWFYCVSSFSSLISPLFIQ